MCHQLNWVYHEEAFLLWNTLRSTLFSISFHARIRGFWKYENPTPVKFLQFEIAYHSFSPFTSIIPYLRGKIAGNEHRKYCCFWPKTWNQISFSTFKDVERRRLIPTKLLLLRKSRDITVVVSTQLDLRWVQFLLWSYIPAENFNYTRFLRTGRKCRITCKAVYYHTCKIIYYPIIIDEDDSKFFSINHYE